LKIIAVGRLKPGPERDLVAGYQARLKSAPAKLGPLEVTEIDERKDASRSLIAAVENLPAGVKLIALDERGEPLATRDLAQRLAGWRDAGVGEACFLIGGADGLPRQVLARTQLTLSLGQMTWPHRLARAMLAEQLYRAASLLSGHPYHRE
jgi:23S rRNA (pseudouridine1915-N3)-methyltransferase